jgi:hypothetical protein
MAPHDWQSRESFALSVSHFMTFTVAEKDAEEQKKPRGTCLRAA